MLYHKDSYQVHLYISGYNTDDLEGRASLFKFLTRIINTYFEFPMNFGIQPLDGKLEIHSFNEKTLQKTLYRIQNNEIDSIHIKPDGYNVIAHPAFGLTYSLIKETNEDTCEYLDVLKFQCNKIDSEKFYSCPDFFAKQFESKLGNINVAYGFIEQFPLNPTTTFPFERFQNSTPLTSKINYWDNYVNGYYWFQLLNPQQMEILQNKNSELLNEMNSITKSDNAYNYILQASDKINEMDEKKYLNLYALLKPVLPNQERLSIAGLINCLIQFKDYSLIDIFTATKLFWHKIDDYKEVISFIKYIQQRYHPFMDYKAEIRAEIKKRGWKI